MVTRLSAILTVVLTAACGSPQCESDCVAGATVRIEVASSPWPFGTYSFELQEPSRTARATCELQRSGVSCLNAELQILTPSNDASGLRAIVVSGDLPANHAPTTEYRLIVRRGPTTVLDARTPLTVTPAASKCGCAQGNATVAAP